MKSAPTPCRLGYEEHDGDAYCHEHGGFAHYAAGSRRCDRASGPNGVRCSCIVGICSEGGECCESHDCPRATNECAHHWLDRPESDTRECLICGTEVFG